MKCNVVYKWCRNICVDFMERKNDNEMTTMSYGITESEMIFFRTGLMMEDLPTALTPGCEWHKSRRWPLLITKFKDVMILKWHPLVTSKRALLFPNTMKRWWRLWSKTEVLTCVFLHERNVLIRLTVCDNIFRSVDFVPIYRKQASNRIHFHERYFHTWQWNDFWHCLESCLTIAWVFWCFLSLQPSFLFVSCVKLFFYKKVH